MLGPYIVLYDVRTVRYKGFCDILQSKLTRFLILKVTFIKLLIHWENMVTQLKQHSRHGRKWPPSIAGA